MTRITSALAALDLPASTEGKLRNFSALFQRWNRNINLSAARSEPEIHDHIIDSLHAIPYLRTVGTQATASPSPANMLDVGAGGGLPAVVVAICLPDTHVTALEPVHKKHAFLRTAARELSLRNLEALPERLEHHQRHDYDAAMSRATFDLREWLLRGAAQVRPGGLVLGFEAVPRLDLPQGTLRHPYHLGDKARAIVTFRTPAT
jgi:16S rRNA (guanine527-N7)-methyltransferase